jgi:tRNA(Arg) A34 adenosine deaminase TadA
MTRKILSYFELAKNIAFQSNHDVFRHGAILVKGSKIINASCNNVHYSKFAKRFLPRGYSERFATRHAELSVVLNVCPENTHGADVYVVRINNDGEFRYSHPCPMCLNVLEFVGIRNVYYSLNGEGYGKVRI